MYLFTVIVPLNKHVFYYFTTFKKQNYLVNLHKQNNLLVESFILVPGGIFIMKHTVSTSEIASDVILTTPVLKSGLNYNDVDNVIIHCSYQYIRTKNRAANSFSNNVFSAYILTTKIFMYPQTDDLKYCLEKKLFKKMRREEIEERVYHIKYKNDTISSLEFPLIEALEDEESQITLTDGEYQMLKDEDITSLYEYITFKAELN